MPVECAGKCPRAIDILTTGLSGLSTYSPIVLAEIYRLGATEATVRCPGPRVETRVVKKGDQLVTEQVTVCGLE